jgi:hypothetical protein
MLRADACGAGQSTALSFEPNVENAGQKQQVTLSTPDLPEQKVEQRPRQRTNGALRRLAFSLGSAVTRGMAAALLIGSLATSAFAQETKISRPVPMNAVSLQSNQARLGANYDKLAIPRTNHDLAAHLQRAALINPFVASFQIPSDQDPLSADVRNFVWRLVARSMHKAEGAPDHTNLIPTTPVNGELTWRAQIKDSRGNSIDVLPLIMPQLAKADGTLDMAKFMTTFSRVSNPAPAASENNVFLASNVGFKNGRAAYFPFDPINPEPIQPMLNATTPALPQFVVELPNGQKVVHTIGALCVKGNGPSFSPQNGGWYGGGNYEAERKKTPLNEELKTPIYTGNSSFGLFNFEPDAKTNEYGWELRDHGAYNGVSIAHIKLNELVDYRLDAEGKVTGSPVAIPVKELQAAGRVDPNTTPSIIWRAFSTEYRLSAYKSPNEGVQVFDNMRALFARDAIFSHIANSPALDKLWQSALDAANKGDATQMTRVWQLAVDSLNRDIKGGKHYIKAEITLDANGIAAVSKDDFVNVAVHRSARNIVVMNELKLNHNSIATGGDNINAAFEIVDNDDLNPSGSQQKGDPKQHQNIGDMTGNIEDAIKALMDRVPELKKYDGKVRDLLLLQIEREVKVFEKKSNNG